ncbi:hypothetical protein Tco_1104994 [Tanacetum coccineum]
MEIDTTPSSPTLMTSAEETTSEGGKKIEGRTHPITPLNPTSHMTSSNQTPSITPVHADVKAVDEAFVMANYSQLELLMRRRMKELRLRGVATRLNYSSEDVDEETLRVY